MSSGRPYDLVIFGATGYTGKLCAEHIVTNASTDLRWAVAGRSRSKLEDLIQHLSSLYRDRRRPGVEVAQLNEDDLSTLARKTRILISTVGPYHLYGTAVVAACAENGTHYLDVTGESPWVLDMIRKYHHVAKANGAIIIPQIGVESAPADVLSLCVAKCIRENLSAGTRELVLSTHDLKGAPSGGTLMTILSILDTYSIRTVTASMRDYAMLPEGVAAKPPAPPKLSLLTRLFGVRQVPDLGTLTTAISGNADRVIVQRSWGLHGGHDSLYGPNFYFSPYMRVRNVLLGVATHLALALGMLFLVVPPLRTILKKLVTQPGSGPSKECVTLELRTDVFQN